MPEISTAWWNGIGVVGFCVLIVAVMVRGWLVPKYFLSILKETYESRLKDKDAMVELLRAQNDRREEALQLQSHQLDDLLATTAATREVLESLKRVAEAGTREAA